MRALGISAGLALLALTGGCATTGGPTPKRGIVELSCVVNADGSLSACRIVREEPAGAGFGEAALQAAARARVSVRTAERSVGERVSWTTRFEATD
ncbi:energy transducer TonB [Brevundimonas sp.]|uniref:energy transducer TonB n=1 Tax=Brevundimonas sp. TaxID=1871086 RepID=UPI002EDA1D8B